MSDYQGVIIEESLTSKDVLRAVRVILTKTEKVTEKHQTPWLRQWTLHTVLVPEAEASHVAEKISESLGREHGGSWYADFRNETHHYVIFPGKIFLIARDNLQQYNEAKAYGLSLGIPEHQVDFHPEVKEWEREAP